MEIKKNRCVTIIIIALVGVIALSTNAFAWWAFTGFVSVDGEPTNGISVSLLIGEHTYRTTSGDDGHGNPGRYWIGNINNTGWYCLKAVLTSSLPGKRDADWGTKSSPGSIRVDLNCTSTGPECQPRD